MVHVGTFPPNNGVSGFVYRGTPSSPASARSVAVISEHGSTPSSRTSRGLGASGAGPSAEGAPGTAVVHPAAMTAVTRSSTARTARR